MQVLNKPNINEITLVVITKEVKESINITITTFNDFMTWIKVKDLMYKKFREELEYQVSQYIMNGGFKVNISIVHTYSGENHIFLA